MLILAHRGYHETEPENTLAAFGAAAALGVDGIETDIRLSSDGVPILFHDRLAGGTPVEQLKQAELSALAGIPVPTLEEALARFPDLFWNLELKTPAALEASVAVLNKFKSCRILISSFWHDLVLEACRRLDLPGGFLIAHAPTSAAGFRTWLSDDPRCRTIIWHWETCTREEVAAARNEGFASFVYDLETRAEFEQFAAWGGQAVIADHPQLFLSLR